MPTASFASYRAVLAVPAARRVLITGTVIRVPIWATSVALTLHVVTHLHRSYAESGLVAALATAGLALSAPWRGKRLDKVGVRRTVGPSLLVLAGGWSVLPHVGYWPLAVGVGLVNLFEVPTFSVVRQALVHAVDEEHRRAALSLDSVLVELSFMVGPAAGVLMATYLPTTVALQACAYATVAGGAALWWQNPAIRADDLPSGAVAPVPEAGPGAAAELEQATPPRRVASWLTAPVVAVLVISAASVMMLTGSDVGIVAALRDMDHQAWIGWELAVWALGSAVGGIVYGALARPVPLVLLVGLLGVFTLAVAAGQGPVSLAVLLFASGCFCAPTITATVDAVTRLVPERQRGEALGWHGSAMTVGSALGSPLGGVGIDRVGWRGAYLTGAVALVLAMSVTPLLRRSPGTSVGETESEPDGDRRGTPQLR